MARWIIVLVLLVCVCGVMPVAAQLKIPEEYEPVIKVEQAAITARRTLAANRFNPKAFEIRSMEYFENVEALENVLKKGDQKVSELAERPYRELAEEFGTGPLWIVRFWRTKKVPADPEYYGIPLGLMVFVYGSSKAALVDIRGVPGADDKIED